MTNPARSGDDPYPIRPVGSDEFDGFHTVDMHAFHGTPLTGEDRELTLARLEFDRTLAAFDGQAQVGTAGGYSFQLSVPGALAGRRYSGPVDTVIEVRDDLLPSNAGRWRLTTADRVAEDGNGLEASCVPAAVSAQSDVALDVAELGAAYLGGTPLGALAGAGLVAERRAGAVRQLSAAMSWDPAPWCPVIF